MIQKDFLSYLISKSKKFAKKYKIFDIVLYGSAVKGKFEPRDIDILIILEDKNQDKIDLAYEFKQILKKKVKELDVKAINITELFDSNFLARQGVLIEGFSLIRNIKFSERFGFKGCSLFTYNLKNLNHNEKTKFTYALIGREKRGMLKDLNAETLGKGAFLIPVEKSLIFQDFLEKWKLNYKKKNILVSLI